MDNLTPHVPEIVYTTGTPARNTLLSKIWMPIKTFLGLPLLMMALFTIFGFGLLAIDQANVYWIQRLRYIIQLRFFQSSAVTANVLDLIAGGLITQISIVTSMLLLVLQQVASNMGNLIYDQFLDRQRNQFYLGFVLGSIVLVVIVRSATDDGHNPVLGAAVGLLLLLSVLALLVWFIYSAIHQMRPETIVNEIHDSTEHAYHQYQQMLSRLRRVSQSEAPIQVTLCSLQNGFLVEIDLNHMQRSLANRSSDVEVIARVGLGEYIAYGGALAAIKADNREKAHEIATQIGQAFVFEPTMQIHNNPQYGFKQLETVAWTEGSTAKQNPETVMMALNMFRDLLMRWLITDAEINDKNQDVERIAFVYPDLAIFYLMDMMESLATVSTESMQHQNFSEILDILSESYPHQPEALRHRSVDMIWRMLSAMGDHVLTGTLELSLLQLEETLALYGNKKESVRLALAHQAFGASLGELHSRASRDIAHKK